MIKMNIESMTKKEIEEYITKDYDNLLKSANFITKNDQTGSDLLNEILIDLLTRENFSEKLNNCYNLYNYIYGAMRIQYFSNNSKYNNMFRKKYTELFDIKNDDDDYDFTWEKIEDFIKKSNIFQKKEENDINLLKKSNKYSIYKEKLIKNRYSRLNLLYKKIFFEYFYSDENLSYDKLKKKFGISILSSRKYIKYILNFLYTSDFFDIIREERKK